MTFVEVLPPEQTGPDHPEWFEARAEGITASEVAAVIGVHPYLSPFALYWQKRGIRPDQPDTARQRFGRRFERYLAEEFSERHPDLFVLTAGTYAHADRPWQLATPDRLAYVAAGLDEQPGGGWPTDVVAVVECKTTGSWEGWGPDGTDQVPLHIRCQVQWQMDVLGVGVAYLPVGSGPTYREYVVQYDKDDAAILRTAAENFLEDVRRGYAPAVDGMDATLQTLKQLHPDLEDAEAKVPNGLAAAYRRACRNLRKAKARKLLLENQLRERMGRARFAVDPDGAQVVYRAVFDVAAATEPRPAYKVDKLVPAREKT